MKELKKSVLFCLGIGSNLELPSAPRYEFGYDLLYQLVPYAPVSVRGAVMGLKDEAAVSVYQRQGQTRIQLTSVGSELLKALFPALKHGGSRKDRPWTVCVFVGESKTSFRPVRDELLRHGFFPLERGVYVFPSSAPEELLNSLSRLHMLHRVLVFETRRLVVGDERAIVRSLFDIRSIEKEGAGIERALTGIRKHISLKDKLHHETRLAYINLIPKAMKFFARELIVPDLYFPQEVRLSDIKQVLFQVSAEILPKL